MLIETTGIENILFMVEILLCNFEYEINRYEKKKIVIHRHVIVKMNGSEYSE